MNQHYRTTEWTKSKFTEFPMYKSYFVMILVVCQIETEGDKDCEDQKSFVYRLFCGCVYKNTQSDRDWYRNAWNAAIHI